MSVETIAIVISAAALLLSFFGAFGWLVRRSDAGQQQLRGEIAALDGKLSGQIATLDDKLSTRIDAVEQRLGDRLGARIDALDDQLSARIDGVARELVEVKIAVARLEGPPRHLLTAR